MGFIGILIGVALLPGLWWACDKVIRMLERL